MLVVVGFFLCSLFCLYIDMKVEVIRICHIITRICDMLVCLINRYN